MDICWWLNANSIGKIEIEIPSNIFPCIGWVAFENSDDALVFRIKYGV
jgi:hypothetical protein